MKVSFRNMVLQVNNCSYLLILLQNEKLTDEEEFSFFILHYLLKGPQNISVPAEVQLPAAKQIKTLKEQFIAVSKVFHHTSYYPFLPYLMGNCSEIHLVMVKFTCVD